VLAFSIVECGCRCRVVKQQDGQTRGIACFPGLVQGSCCSRCFVRSGCQLFSTSTGAVHHEVCTHQHSSATCGTPATAIATCEQQPDGNNACSVTANATLAKSTSSVAQKHATLLLVLVQVPLAACTCCRCTRQQETEALHLSRIRTLILR
jgi:hypothetical protein